MDLAFLTDGQAPGNMVLRDSIMNVSLHVRYVGYHSHPSPMHSTERIWLHKSSRKFQTGLHTLASNTITARILLVHYDRPIDDMCDRMMASPTGHRDRQRVSDGSMCVLERRDVARTVDDDGLRGLDVQHGCIMLLRAVSSQMNPHAPC